MVNLHVRSHGRFACTSLLRSAAFCCIEVTCFVSLLEQCNSPPACKVCPVGPQRSAPPMLQPHDLRWTQWPLQTWGGGCLPPHDLDVGSRSSPKIFPESDSLLRSSSSACYSTYAWRLASPIDCIAEKRSASVKSVGIVPRHKPQNAQVGANHRAVVINWDSIKPLFGMPLCDAAKSLGISFTSLKTICRRLGNSNNRGNISFLFLCCMLIY